LVISDVGTDDVLPGSKDSNDRAIIAGNPSGIVDVACTDTNGARNTSRGIIRSILAVVTRSGLVSLKEMMADQNGFGMGA